MKVFIGTDLEGVAGVVSFATQSYADGKYFEQAKRLLTAEVNAAVEVLAEHDIDDILVCDGHGPGAIRFEDLHPAAKLLHGRPSASRAARDEAIKDYDVCMMIGQHAMAGIPTANLNHTQSSATIDRITLNGQSIGEIAQFALYHGAFGIPLIFLSGDEAACQEARDLVPRIATAAVKKGLGRNSAISLSAPAARQRIRNGVKEALLRHRESPIPPVVWDAPYVLEKRFFHTDSADAAAGTPGAERVDGQTVRFRADAIQAIIYR